MLLFISITEKSHSHKSINDYVYFSVNTQPIYSCDMFSGWLSYIPVVMLTSSISPISLISYTLTLLFIHIFQPFILHWRWCLTFNKYPYEHLPQTLQFLDKKKKGELNFWCNKESNDSLLSTYDCFVLQMSSVYLLKCSISQGSRTFLVVMRRKLNDFLWTLYALAFLNIKVVTDFCSLCFPPSL